MVIAIILEVRSTSTAKCMTKEAIISNFYSYAPNKVKFTKIGQKIRFFSHKKVVEWLNKDELKIRTMVRSTFTLWLPEEKRVYTSYRNFTNETMERVWTRNRTIHRTSFT